MKKILFYSILFIPLIVLLVILSVFAKDIIAMNAVDTNQIAQDIETYLQQKQGYHFNLPNQVFNLDPAKKSVYILGGSSVMLTRGNVFSHYLQEKDDSFQIINLGVSGIDSFSVLTRLEDVLAVAKPDVLIIYYGHNDYTNVYQGVILPNHFALFDTMLKIMYKSYDTTKPVSEFSDGSFFWFARLNRPKIITFFQKIGLITINQEDFKEVNDIIYKHFETNHQSIIDVAIKENIPLIFITPISNLRAQPYGDAQTIKDYKKGIRADRYQESIHLLTKAKDSEIFTYDHRAKTSVIERIRNSEQENIYVYDLEKSLITKQASFEDEFVDYFHLSDNAHKFVAEELYALLKNQKII